MVDPNDPTIRFDVEAWKPASIDAHYVDPIEYRILKGVSEAEVRTQADLLALKREIPDASLGNGLAYYLLADKAAQAGLGDSLMEFLEKGNKSELLYIPTAVPVPLSNLTYFGEMRKIPRYPLYWSLEEKIRLNQEPLIVKAIQRLVLCAPVTFIKILIGVSGWRAVLAQARWRHIRKLRLRSVIETYTRMSSLQSTAHRFRPIVPMSFKLLEKEFRDGIEEIIPITDAEFRLLCQGLPIEDEDRMRILEKEARQDYEVEYDTSCKWIEAIRLQIP